MATHPTYIWTGASGTEYKYHIWTLPASIAANSDGNYIFAKKNAQGNWVPIYIGQGDLGDRANNHHKSACIAQNGATHFHCHLKGSKAERLSEERDLLGKYAQAYDPSGCNEREGG